MVALSDAYTRAKYLLKANVVVPLIWLQLGVPRFVRCYEKHVRTTYDHSSDRQTPSDSNKQHTVNFNESIISNYTSIASPLWNASGQCDAYWTQLSINMCTGFITENNQYLHKRRQQNDEEEKQKR